MPQLTRLCTHPFEYVFLRHCESQKTNYLEKNRQADDRKSEEQIVAKVEIFTAQGCGYCVRALRLLQNKDIAVEHTDVTLSSSLRATLRSRAGGATSVPQIFIDDNHIGGCDELMQLDRLGHLDRLLQA